MNQSTQGQPFLLGVNYWPRRKAMFWWSRFEADEVREEFGIIADVSPSSMTVHPATKPGTSASSGWSGQMAH